MKNFKSLLWIIPLSVLISVVLSVPAVWLITKTLGFEFSEKTVAIVAMLASAGSALAIMSSLKLKEKSE
jgi:hypothetical protein